MSGADHNRVPIKMKDFSVVDAEFGNIRERFDSEMRKMEEEMNKFRTELLNNESKVFSKSARSSTKSSFQSSSTSKAEKYIDGKKVFDDSSSFATSNITDNSSNVMSDSGLGNHSNWLQGLNSPLIRDAQGQEGASSSSSQKELKLRFDVSQYQPEEIMVKTVDNKLLVHAKHEEKGEGKSVYREYNREFLLPSGTDPEAIRSSLSKDGVLTVEAPLPQPALTQEK